MVRLPWPPLNLGLDRKLDWCQGAGVGGLIRQLQIRSLSLTWRILSVSGLSFHLSFLSSHGFYAKPIPSSFFSAAPHDSLLLSLLSSPTLQATPLFQTKLKTPRCGWSDHPGDVKVWHCGRGASHVLQLWLAHH